MIVVANAGPLIALAHIDQFDLLQSLYGQLNIPPAVRDEVVTSGQGRPAATEVDSAEWISVIEVHDTTAVQLLNVNHGEETWAHRGCDTAVEQPGDFRLSHEPGAVSNSSRLG